MGKPRTDVSDKQIVDVYRETLSAYETARRFGVSTTTVYRVLYRNDIARDGLANYRQSAERYTRETQQEMRALYESGVSAPDLANRFGGSIDTVCQAIRRVGGTMRPPSGKKRRIVPEGRVKQICDMYKSGMSQTQIANLLSFGQTTISRILIENGMRVKERTRHHKYGGGRAIHHQGYFYVWLSPDDPMAGMRLRNGYVLEHRLVMARVLGRVLLERETVHHINGKRDDNRPENLELRQGKHGKHIAMCCLDCGSRRIGPAPLES
jgi:transposase